MHEYHSQHHVVTTYYGYTSFVVFLAEHIGKHSSGTFYVAFRDPGQILKIRDCPGDSGTVGAYAARIEELNPHVSLYSNEPPYISFSIYIYY